MNIVCWLVGFIEGGIEEGRKILSREKTKAGVRGLLIRMWMIRVVVPRRWDCPVGTRYGVDFVQLSKQYYAEIKNLLMLTSCGVSSHIYEIVQFSHYLPSTNSLNAVTRSCRRSSQFSNPTLMRSNRRSTVASDIVRHSIKVSTPPRLVA